MSPHESFWVATAAAAPVVALAAIVALPDTSVAVEEVYRHRHDPVVSERARNGRQVIVARLWSRNMAYVWSQLVWMVSIVNLLLQAALLAMSLLVLVYDQEVIPPWAAIVFSAGGILLLTWSSTSAAAFRRFLEPPPDSESSSKNKKSPP